MVLSSADSSTQASAMPSAHSTLLHKLKTKKIWSVLGALTQPVNSVMQMNLKFANDVRLDFMYLKNGA